MENTFLSLLAGAALCATAAAGTFSVSGPGGAIPDCPFTPGMWNTQPTWATFTSPVTVNYNVTSITAVKLTGLTHSWRGDVHVFLSDPNDVRYNIIVRPGFDGSTAGDAGNYTLGDYEIVETGGGLLAQGATNIAPGTYNQYLNTAAGMWTSGTYVIGNTLMTAGPISGPKGTWTLNVVDWFAGDTGSLDGWTLEGTDTSGFVDFCSSPSDVTCPCSNGATGAEPRGCNNHDTSCDGSPGGARLTLSGEARITTPFDTLVMTVTEEYSCTALTLFLQSDTLIFGAPFGAGMRCIDGNINRLYVGNASGGAISRPNTAAGDPDITDRSIALSRTINSGDTRYYMTYYRSPTMAVPCSNAAATFNSSQTVGTTWGL